MYNLVICIQDVTFAPAYGLAVTQLLDIGCVRRPWHSETRCRCVVAVVVVLNISWKFAARETNRAVSCEEGKLTWRCWAVNTGATCVNEITAASI